MAGRLMSKRGMGKVSFCDMQDKSGRIQLYARKDEMDEAEYARFKKYDIGDIVGVKGIVFRTQRGEMSVRVVTCTLLSKSLLPLPEKFHGLTSTELRYRQRYVDLVMNREVRDTFEKRFKVVSAIRRYIDERNLDCELEVDGGVDAVTCKTCIEAGANVLVAGSAVYKAADIPAKIKELRG